MDTNEEMRRMLAEMDATTRGELYESQHREIAELKRQIEAQQRWLEVYAACLEQSAYVHWETGDWRRGKGTLREALWDDFCARGAKRCTTTSL